MAKVAANNRLFKNLVDCVVRNTCNRMYVKLSVTKKPEVNETPIYSKTDEEYAFGKQHIVKKLEELLGIKTFSALNIANKYRSLSSINGKTMTDNYQLCKDAGIKRSTILKYPELLVEKDLRSKVELIKQLPYDVNKVSPLILMEYNKLRRFIDNQLKGMKVDRIHLVSKLLDVDVIEACEFLYKRSFLQTKPVKMISENIKVLLEYGIPLEDIRRDIWVLCYSLETITERLDKARGSKIETLKTWMVRCQPEIFNHYIQRRTDNKEILGNSSLAEYLSERLECTVEQAALLISKQPAIKNKSMKRVKETLDFLFSEGFKPHHICRSPKILMHSVETMKARLTELKPYGKELDSLYMLTKSKRQFTQFVESLEKSRKKMQSSS